MYVVATEWVGKKEGERSVRIKFDKSKKTILVQTSGGKPLRTIDLSILAAASTSSENKTVDVIISADRNLRLLLIRVPKEYDLVKKPIISYHHTTYVIGRYYLLNYCFSN